LTGAANVPEPELMKTPTDAAPLLVMAKSLNPSAFKSLMTKLTGVVPVV